MEIDRLLVTKFLNYSLLTKIGNKINNAFHFDLFPGER